MPPSEMEKLFRAFAEERKRALPRFTPDGIPITMENKFDDAIYHYLYAYWKEQSGEYDPKDDEIIMTKENSFTKNEKKFEQWLLQQYGMTNKEQREYTLKGNLESLWEIFSAADMVLFARGLPSIGKELAQLGKKAVDDVAEEAIEKTVKTEVSEEAVENTAKKEMADTTEDLSQKTVKKEDMLKDNKNIKVEKESFKWPSAKGLVGHDFENYLHKVIDGESQYIKGSVAGRDFDGVIGNRWYEAKSGNYWNTLLKDKSVELKFKQKMSEGLKIAQEYGATYELFSNSPIPDSIKAWLTKKGISFTEILH